MSNIVFIETSSNLEDNNKLSTIKLPLQSFITYCLYKYCAPEKTSLNFVFMNKNVHELSLDIKDDSINFMNENQVPWQVKSCIYPVVLYEDTVITGLCAVARHISKFRTTPQSPHEHEEGLLGFRKSCLQAPNEVSVWTKFCEVDILTAVREVLRSETLHVIPQSLARFENHLKKPVRVHNVYKIARNIKKGSANVSNNTNEHQKQDINQDKDETSDKRVPKPRKWKSNTKKELEIDSSTKIEELNIVHQFAEGPFLTLADIILLPSYYILMQMLGEPVFESLLPLTSKWYKNVITLPQSEIVIGVMQNLKNKALIIDNLVLPTTEDVSLYKCDPKRHNPKKRMFTKEDDIENALGALLDGMEFNVSNNDFETGIDWSEIPSGANPTAGHLPDDRIVRKSQQLENLALAVLKIAKEGDLIVDFCSGSGHLGILIAYLLPKCTVILLENKEQSLLRARARVHEMNLKNIYFFQCNLDFFIGKFDVGIALHACGIASDLVLDKCLKANAKFVICPCCYGSLHATDRLAYPRSRKFNGVSIDQYLCIGHAADQTHEEHPLTVRGAKCMAVIDSDRGRLAEEFGYKITLSRLKPLTCTPKNNLLIGVPS